MKCKELKLNDQTTKGHYTNQMLWGSSFGKIKFNRAHKYLKVYTKGVRGFGCTLLKHTFRRLHTIESNFG